MNKFSVIRTVAALVMCDCGRSAPTNLAESDITVSGHHKKDQSTKQFKYVLLGDSGVGKTSILQQYVHNSFDEEQESTIGLECASSSFLAKDCATVLKLQIWDTAGQEQFRSITRSYFRNVDAVVLVYDITNRRTFESIPRWLDDVDHFTTKPVLKILVGNKYDLEQSRRVTYNEAADYACDHGMVITETSAKTRKGIQNCFEKTANLLRDKELLQEK